MSGFTGMDVTAARQLAGKIVSVGEEVGARLVSLASELPSVQWVGSDGDDFRDRCAVQLKDLMTKVEQAAEEWSTHVHKHATEQENASART